MGFFSGIDGRVVGGPSILAADFARDLPHGLDKFLDVPSEVVVVEEPLQHRASPGGGSGHGRQRQPRLGLVLRAFFQLLRSTFSAKHRDLPVVFTRP